MKRGIEQVGADFYVLKGAGAVVEFTGGKARDVNYGADVIRQGALEIAPWGADNLQPQQMLQLVYGNHLKPQLIKTARDLVVGSRLGLFTQSVVEGKIKLEPAINPQISDWLEQVDAYGCLLGSAFNLELSANYFTAMSLDKNRKVVAMDPFDCTDVRAVATVKRRIEQYVLHPNWREFKLPEARILPAYDPTDSSKYGDFIYHGRDRTPGQKYYDCPPWWGTKGWTEVSNMIPVFHKSGLKNGYNIKYHIRIPRDYFAQFGDAEAQRSAEKALMESMNEMLSGVENADKAFVSKFENDPVSGRARDGWSIEPIANTMSDKAYTELNTQANIAHASGHGINPTLANIDTGRNSGNSGSELRSAFQLHVAIHTPVKRRILLQQFRIAQLINGFDPTIIIGIEDTDVTTLAENPTGKQKVANESM